MVQVAMLAFLAVLAAISDAAVLYENFFAKRAAESDIRDESLRLHNAKRALHKDTNPLVWDSGLYRAAKSYAQYLASRNSGIQHSTGAQNGAYGENLYYSSSSFGSKSIATAINAWYDESKGYNYGTNYLTSGKGHFTQMIWAGNIDLGCAREIANTGSRIKTYIVCMYTPGGNVGGYFKQNVHQLNGSPSAGCDEPAWCSSLAAQCNVASFAGVLAPCRKTCNKC